MRCLILGEQIRGRVRFLFESSHFYVELIFGKVTVLVIMNFVFIKQGITFEKNRFSFNKAIFGNILQFHRGFRWVNLLHFDINLRSFLRWKVNFCLSSMDETHFKGRSVGRADVHGRLVIVFSLPNIDALMVYVLPRALFGVSLLWIRSWVDINLSGSLILVELRFSGPFLIIDAVGIYNLITLGLRFTARSLLIKFCRLYAWQP